jgi:hypothetical protein
MSAARPQCKPSKANVTVPPLLALPQMSTGAPPPMKLGGKLFVKARGIWSIFSVFFSSKMLSPR